MTARYHYSKCPNCGRKFVAYETWCKACGTVRA